MSELRLQWPTLAEFLADAPPGKAGLIENLIKFNASALPTQRHVVRTPDVYTDCIFEGCDGFRNFYCLSPDVVVPNVNGTVNAFLSYSCRNCRRSYKTFALTIQRSDDGPTGVVSKIGETPPFGPRTPARVITLLGPERDNFLKGRRCETQGLGVGAFSYYRRIVENARTRIYDRIIDACKAIQAGTALIDELERARNDTQFTKGFESFKGMLPDILKVRGHNPLTLLHDALSCGLHAETDEECLEIATSIRALLFALTERMEAALASNAELMTAVSTVLKRKESKSEK